MIAPIFCMFIPKRLFLYWFALLLLVSWAGSVEAADPKVIRIEPKSRNGKLEIDVDIYFDLNHHLREALERGLPLYFTADVVMRRSRWWWFDTSVADTSMTWRIVYNALTRQWQVGTGELFLPVSSLEAAMDVVRHIRGWMIARTADLSPGVRYQGQLRLRLDTSLLARPFQVDAFNSRSWAMRTPWTDFEFVFPSPASKTQ